MITYVIIGEERSNREDETDRVTQLLASSVGRRCEEVDQLVGGKVWKGNINTRR